MRFPRRAGVTTSYADSSETEDALKGQTKNSRGFSTHGNRTPRIVRTLKGSTNSGKARFETWTSFPWVETAWLFIVRPAGRGCVRVPDHERLAVRPADRLRKRSGQHRRKCKKEGPAGICALLKRADVAFAFPEHCGFAVYEADYGGRLGHERAAIDHKLHLAFVDPLDFLRVPQKLLVRQPHG